MINPQIASPQVSTKNAQLSRKTILKIVCVNFFYVKIWKWAYSQYLVRRKSPPITNRLGPQIANPQNATFAEGPQI